MRIEIDVPRRLERALAVPRWDKTIRSAALKLDLVEDLELADQLGYICAAVAELQGLAQRAIEAERAKRPWWKVW